jgi:hypothetical protein
MTVCMDEEKLANAEVPNVRPPQGTPPTRPRRRLAREEKTIATMIGMYCRDHHGTRGAPGEAGGLCEECAALLEYARRRLEHCPYGLDKPTCAKCTTHCYKPAMREQVRAVMRYAGPRMLKEHPLLAAAHLTDGRRSTSRRRPG